MAKAAKKKREPAEKDRVAEPMKPDFSGNIEKTGFPQKRIIHLLLIVCLGFLAYANTFHNPFQWDDIKHISANPLIKDLDNFFSSPKGFAFNPRRFTGYLTFALNYYAGGTSVTGYHIVNIFIHVANAILVYFLILLTFKTPSMLQAVNFSSRAPVEIALFSALLFISHPVQTQAVTYIVQRFASLATMFYLSALVMYVRGRLAEQEQPETKSRFMPASSLLFYFLSLIFAALAMTTKEIAFTLPIMTVLYELTFFKSSLKRKLLFLLPVVLIVAIILISVVQSGKPLGEMLSDLGERTRVQTHMSRWDYLMTETRVIMTYLRLIILPVNQNFDYDYPRYNSIFDPLVLFSFLFLASLFCAAVYLLYRSRQADKLTSLQADNLMKRGGFHYSLFTTHYSRLIGFGILWFFITLSIESSVIPIIDVIFEHRVYLPSFGLFIVITTVMYTAAHRLKMERTATYALLLIALIFSGVTYARNNIWKSKITLWEDVVRKSPGKARGHNNLGTFYMEEGSMDKALEEFQAAVKLEPDYADAHYNLGTLYYSRDLMDEAIREFQAALTLNPDYADAHNNLGNAYIVEDRIDDAIREYQTAIRLDPGHVSAQKNLGIAYKMLQSKR